MPATPLVRRTDRDRSQRSQLTGGRRFVVLLCAGCCSGLRGLCNGWWSGDRACGGGEGGGHPWAGGAERAAAALFGDGLSGSVLSGDGLSGRALSGDGLSGSGLRRSTCDLRPMETGRAGGRKYTVGRADDARPGLEYPLTGRGVPQTLRQQIVKSGCCGMAGAAPTRQRLHGWALWSGG